MRGLFGAAVLLAMASLGASSARSQSQAQEKVKGAVEPNALPSSSGFAARLYKPATPDPTIPSKQDVSPHLVAPAGPQQDEVNRRDFEGNAGINAGKMLLRSLPSGAQIFINDLFVGQTPLLLSIAPGKYKIEMRGPRQELGHSVEIVVPKETHTTLLNLSQRYPASFAMH